MCIVLLETSFFVRYSARAPIPYFHVTFLHQLIDIDLRLKVNIFISIPNHQQRLVIKLQKEVLQKSKKSKEIKETKGAEAPFSMRLFYGKWSDLGFYSTPRIHYNSY